MTISTVLAQQINRDSINKLVAQLKEEYEVGEDNCAPQGSGSFDGMPLYVIYYYYSMMDGGSDYCTENENGYYADHFRVTELDKELIPGLNDGIAFHDGKTTFVIWKDDQGFVHYDFVG